MLEVNIKTGGRMMIITLKDGSKKEYSEAKTVIDVA